MVETQGKAGSGRARLRLASPVAAVIAAVGVLAAAPAQARVPVPYMRGVTLAAWGAAGYDPGPTAAALKRLRRAHADTVTLLATWAQANSKSNAVAPGQITQPTGNLVKAIKTARKLHLRVVLRPYVDPADGSWRGQIHPGSTSAWFASYGRFLVKYATFAQKLGVKGLVIGTEMTTLSGDAPHWRGLVAAVRRHFKGFVSYQANWLDEPKSITWWSSLDAISISAYYELSPGNNPSLASLLKAWTTTQNVDSTNWFQQIAALGAAQHLPVFFGEIGYRTVADTAAQPWSDVDKQGLVPSVEAQRRATQAALQVWSRVPWFRGFGWWYMAAGGAPVHNDPGAGHQLTDSTLRTISQWYAKRR